MGRTMRETAMPVRLGPGDRVIDASGRLAVYLRRATHRWNKDGACPAVIADWASEAERETYEPLRRATVEERVAQGEFTSLACVPAYLLAAGSPSGGHGPLPR